MKRLVEFIARSLVDNPDAVKVEDVPSAGGYTVYEVSCDPEEKGKLIGRAGRTAKAMRTVVRSAGARQGKKVTVEIV
ncbi:MAG: KH domain-containing protein [Firmicutes bacterium]|nr:KH domain-containing protein [Bacillota bacterium]